MKKVIATLLKIAEIEKLRGLVLVDPVKGVVLGGPWCGVQLNFYEGKWHLVVLDGRMVYVDKWYDDEKEVVLATLDNFTLKKPAEEYVKEFFDDGNIDEKQKSA